MACNGFVDYLNSLHNYNAQNENAYSEKSISSPWYEKIAVRIGLGNYITEVLNGDDPQIIILTGHAGDGKTSIMYQVLKDFGLTLDVDAKFSDKFLPSGKTCRCIKDFSELAEDEKCNQMSEAFDFPKQGNFVFMVANTGPLINTFKELFHTEDEQERAEIKLIESMDKNQGVASDVLGYRINVINVAAIDNTYFAKKLLTNFIKPELWTSCSGCDKKERCPIYRNVKLILENKEKTLSFISAHYVWLYEHGKRLTVRSMTEQLAYMITGGLSCDKTKNPEPYKYLYPNLFFGFKGTVSDPKAENILAVRAAKSCRYDTKRLRADEGLIIERDYKHLFSPNVSTIVSDAEKTLQGVTGWKEMLHRLYFFSNIITDQSKNEQDSADIFSGEFNKYFNLRNGLKEPGHHDFDFIVDALSMIYMGATNKDKEIPLTLSRNNGAIQNVQLIVGEISKKKLSVKLVPGNPKLTDSDNGRNSLEMTYEGEDLGCELTLPLLNYFDELRKGIISTNIDPLLSHGVEGLKAQLSKFCIDDEDDDDSLKIVILKNKENVEYILNFEEDGSVKLC